MLRIGYLAEGTDILILHHLVCRLLGLEETAVSLLRHVSRPGKRSDVADRARLALRKFYYGHAIAAILEVDNDGQVDLRRTGKPEDPHHPRHWVHVEQGRETCEACRFCWLSQAARDSASGLGMEHFVSGAQWCIVMCVPTEAIEAWLLIARGLSQADNALLDAERRPAGVELKRALYGEPYVTEEAVRTIALPILQALDDVRRIGQYARSFALFSERLLGLRPQIEAAASRLGTRL